MTAGINLPRPRWSQSAALKKIAATVLKALREADEEAIKRTAAAHAKEFQDRAKVARGTPPPNLPDEKKLAQTLTALKTLYARFYAKAGDRGEDALATALGAARPGPGEARWAQGAGRRGRDAVSRVVFQEDAPDWDLLLSRHAVVLQFVSEREVHREQLRGLTETIIKGAANALGSWMIRK